MASTLLCCAKLEEKGLSLNPESDPRTLIRRLTFDLTGLPPTPEEIDDFRQGNRTPSRKRLMKSWSIGLLASPHYGERWGRHWLDVGPLRRHARLRQGQAPAATPGPIAIMSSAPSTRTGPIRRFIQEQLAGDVLLPGTRDGIVAPGFIAAGPWDFVGQVELREGTLDKKITRILDRDDMVATTMNTFVSLTVQCARCHDHKFDPIDAGRLLQSASGVRGRGSGRPALRCRRRGGAQRARCKNAQAELTDRNVDLETRLQKLAGPDLPEPDRKSRELINGPSERPS